MMLGFLPLLILGVGVFTSSTAVLRGVNVLAAGAAAAIPFAFGAWSGSSILFVAAVPFAVAAVAFVLDGLEERRGDVAR